MLDSTVSSSHYVYLCFTMHSQQDVLLTHLNKFPFLLAKGVIWASFRQLAGVIFTHTYLLRLISMKKNYSAIARRKNIPFYPARTGISFPHFQLARRYFRFPSKLITQCNFSQPAQIRHEQQVFCQAAPLGTPDEFAFDIGNLAGWQLTLTRRVQGCSKYG